MSNLGVRLLRTRKIGRAVLVPFVTRGRLGAGVGGGIVAGVAGVTVEFVGGGVTPAIV